MIVSELIEALQRFNPHQTVEISCLEKGGTQNGRIVMPQTVFGDVIALESLSPSESCPVILHCTRHYRED